MDNTQSRTEQPDSLTASLMHTNVKRIGVGIVSGLIAGVIMLLLTTLIPMGTYGKLWWLQLTGSAFFSGKAFLLETPPAVFFAGAVVHFAVAGFCGFIVGKMTSRNELPRLLFYSFVLGFLCWLSSNMFGPDILDYQFLQMLPQWTRFFLFEAFTLSLGVIMSVLGKAAKV